MITPAQLLEAAPEFEGAPLAMLQTAIDDAATCILEDMFRETYDQAVRLLACHNLALSPYGQSAKLSAANGDSTYYTRFMKLQRDAGTGFRVL